MKGTTMLKWKVTKSDQGVIIIAATLLWEAAKIAEERYAFPDSTVLAVETYYGKEKAINE